MSRTSSYYDVSSMAPFEENRKRYTVQRTDSSASDVSAKLENGRFFYVFIRILKWISAVIIFLAVLFCIVTSKICLLVLGQQFKSVHETRANTSTAYSAEINKQALVIMLVLALMIPQAMSLIYASWTSLRRKSRPWPTKQGIILILIGGALEAVSLNYITVIMLTVLPVNPDAIVLFMCSLSAVSAIWQAFKSRSQWETPKGKLDVIKFTTAAVLALTGMVMLSLKVPDLTGQIGIPVAFILLSIAWSPKLRKLQIQSKQQTSQSCDSAFPVNSVSGISFNNNDSEQGDARGPPVKIQTARGKAGIISSLWKLFLTPLVAMIFSKIYDIFQLEDIYSGLAAITTSNPSFIYFMVHILTSFFGYHLGWLACSLCMQRIGYALPLTLATPIAVLITHVRGLCETDALPLPCASEDLAYSLGAGLLLWLSQFLATTYYVWKSQGQIMAKAHDLLWIPSYNGVCFEQYLLLNRRNQSCDEEHVVQQHLSSNIHVFICTTMYHEEDYEMEQLLRSIHDVDMNSAKSGRHFESHVFFDGCVMANVYNNYVLKLTSLVEKTLDVSLTKCTKMKTPYGMQLKWKLPGGMDFTIHLKDNAKVKNKKRWSQVMYMSYVLDFKEELLTVQDDQCFILTTDADVKFTHESVEALIDQIIEDPKTGAVCARTHPLGDGPVVWYQIFDYAIGHWFQKVANHMLGSVLCSPGCFSLYRCQAVRDVLPTYATGVSHAFEFLTKDMGEDRWMCTLMVQRGWRLTYCAAAEDSTYCPESFEEFYKQRRRWTPSTLANLVLLVSEWKRILRNNEHISFLFILYQTFLVCSTVIGPSTVILVIVGGMIFSGLALNEITTVILLSLIVVAYVFVCLFTSQNVQIKVSKLLTFVFAVIMCIVIIGVAVQISNELKERNVEPTVGPTLEPNTTSSPAPTNLEHHLPAGVSTLYLAGLSGIFLASALLHPNEFTCLLHGIWYILCLPSGYLLLTIYSLCNLTDRSWGTREGKSTVADGDDWYKPFRNCLKKVCKCCQGQEESEQFRLSHQGKRGSIIEGRTNITVELSNSSSKITGLSDPNANTGTAFAGKENVHKIDTKNALSLPAADICKADGEVLNERSTKTSTDCVQPEREHQTSVVEDDCVQQTNEPARIVVYSANEIPRKKRGRSSKSTLLEGAMNNSNGGNSSRKMSSDQSSEPGPSLDMKTLQQENNNGEVERTPSTSHTGKEDNNINETRDYCQENWANKRTWQIAPISEEEDYKSKSQEVDEHNHCNEEFQTYSRKRSISCPSLASISASKNSPKGYSSAIPVTVPRKLSESSQVKHTEISQGNQDFPIVISTIIESSQSIILDNPEAMSNTQLSFASQAELSIPAPDEIIRPGSALRNEVSHYDLNSPVDDWLPDDLKGYAPNFRDNGYETTEFIAGMTDKDLDKIGIKIRGHRQKLLRNIKRIPRVDIEENIPENVEDWLKEHGLEEYWPTFKSNGYAEPSDLEDLKNISKESLKDIFHIQKPGHLSRLLSVIRKLQYPNQGQMKIRHTRRELDRLPLRYLDVDNSDDGNEYRFWEELRQVCLIPEMSAFDQTSELKEKLVELRNTTLLVFGVSNALWMIIILTLVQHKDLKILGVDIIGLGFLTIYGGIFTIQFLALLCHRFKTLIHILARTPWKIRNNRVSPA